MASLLQVGREFDSAFDVSVLRSLIAAYEQDDQVWATLRDVGCGLLPLQRHHFDQGGTRLGDHERFAFGRTFDQTGELSLGIVDVDGEPVGLQVD
ncbi:MAG: hypothetical protein WAT23_15495 [Chromatiaceae bacterium]